MKNLGEVCMLCGDDVVQGDGSQHHMVSDISHHIVCNVAGCGTKTEHYCVEKDGTEKLFCPVGHQQTVKRVPI